jgi:hypothetical protein
MKPEKHLIWEETYAQFPNERYNFAKYTFYVLGSRVCSVYGPSEADPYFRSGPNGRKHYESLSDAKKRVIKKWIVDANTEIHRLQRMLKIVKDHLAE